LELRITFQHPLLPAIKECLPCKKIRSMTEDERIRNNIGGYPEKLVQFSKLLESMKPQRFCVAQ
jgi:hypothetical protein